MRPYIGILIDSFWEALGNKVLWALLIGWSIILVGLAPFGYVSERSFQLSSADIDNRSQLQEKLAKGAKEQGSPSVQAVAARLDEDFLEKLRSRSGDDKRENRILPSELAKELNIAIKSEDLYSEEAFPTAKRRKRLQPLIEAEPGSLSKADREELNRELVQLAFPLELNRPMGEQLWIGYAGFKIGEPLPISRRQISQFLEPLFLGVIIKLGLAVLAVFVAIIVTSPIIPDTFRSGSLHLLLSKPISRVWLYLSKFFGGCTFVFMNISFVLIGLYLIAGFRFGIWNSGLLACIPLLMFVFVIFYSVSGLAGLIWGNAIVCVVSCMIFWFGCFSLSFIHDLMLPQVEMMPQISRIRQIEDKLTVVNEKGDFGVWNDEFQVWQPGIKSNNGGQTRTFGPIYADQSNQVIIKSFMRVPFGSLVARTRKINMINLSPEDEAATEVNQAEKDSSDAAEVANDAADSEKEANADEAQEPSEDGEDVDSENEADRPKNVQDAREKPLWVSDFGPELPPQVFDMVEVGDAIVAVCRGGIFKLDLEKLDLIEASEKALFGFKMPWATKSAFENIAPDDYYLSDNSYAAPTTGEPGLIIYSSGNVDHLSYADGKLELVANAKLEGDGTEAAIVQMNQSYCVVARDELPLEILDADLEAQKSVDVPRNGKVKQMAWIPGTNELAIVTHTGELLRLDCAAGNITDASLPYAGRVTSMSWLDDSHVYLGVKPNRVYKIDTAAQTVEMQYVPRSTTLERIYGLAIKPLYSVSPKPAALDNAMSYLLSGSDTQTLNVVTNDLEAAQVELDVWTPILSNLAFVAVMLTLSCVYVARKEF